MKPSTTSISLLLTALISAAIVADAGPVSTLYLTAGDNSVFFLVQGNTVTEEPEVHAQEYAIAVLNTVETLNAYSGQLGNEYTLAGTALSTTYANNYGSEMIDGTTDGAYNYAVQWDAGTVVRFGLDWSNPEVVATGLDSDTIGITYDTADGTFWTASRGANTIYHYSSSWNLLGSFAATGGPAGLAYDPADGTLWAVAQSNDNSLEQYSTGGVLLSTLSNPLLGSVNTLGAEFSLSRVPEPSTMALGGVCGLLLLLIRRKKA